MKVILTIDDVIMLIREEYELPDDVQVEIEGFVKVHASGNTTDTASDAWIDVPSDWSKHYPPSTINGFSKIEVTLRNGKVMQGLPTDWKTSWVQEDNPYDIIKFRKLS